MEETLEEAASIKRALRWHKEGTVGFMQSKGDFKAGIVWQTERMYIKSTEIMANLEKSNRHLQFLVKHLENTGYGDLIFIEVLQKQIENNKQLIKEATEL